MPQAKQKDEKTKRPKNGKTLKRVTKRTNKVQELPKEIFGQKVNNLLLAQAVRVYRDRLSRPTSKVKTRSEVDLTKAKWYRQKGTGRARHGAQSAPLFVGGGVAHGPKGVKRVLKLPKKMRKLALVSALSEKANLGGVKVIDAKPITKTKEAKVFFDRLGVLGKKFTLFVDPEEQNFARVIRNIDKAQVAYENQISVLSVLSGGILVFTSQALVSLKKRFAGKESI